MIRIGKLQVNIERREVTSEGLPLRIGSRAFGVLEILIAARGSLVSKGEIMDRVWPNTIVEENNLQVQIAALRRALGEDRELIRTVPGRGYLLVEPDLANAGQDVSITRNGLREMPVPAELIGREAAVNDIGALLTQSPVLTLVGAGGIGKTSLAIRVAREYGHRFAGNVRYVELAPIEEPQKVALAAAQACGVRVAGDVASAACLAEGLAHQQCLVILDNAEHVVAAVAELVDALAPCFPAVTILVTSREPLRVTNESIYRVEPLDVVPANASLEHLCACPAVRLFMQRAQALGRSVGTDERSMRLVGEICQRLEGIPLAIELAAARSAALGISGVCLHLDDRLQMLGGGQRNALPRHQTLRATFDWSYTLLDMSSRKLFRRLGVFSEEFTLEAACAVAMDEDMSLADVITGISELTTKCLLNVGFENDVARYRLSESTRAYAMEKLQDEGGTQQIVERHARFTRLHLDEHLLDALFPTDLWCQYCDCLGARRNELAEEGNQSLGRFEENLDVLRARGSRHLLTLSVIMCAASLARRGRIGEAKRWLADTLSWCEVHGEQLLVPEIWHVMGIVALEEVALSVERENLDLHAEQ